LTTNPPRHQIELKSIVYDLYVFNRINIIFVKKEENLQVLNNV